MWSTITVVSSGLTLVAFLIAAVAASFRAWLRHRERQLRAAPPSARAGLVRALNNSILFPVGPLSTASLTADQKYDLFLALLRDRSDRFRHTSIVIVVLALIASGVTIFAMTRPLSRTQPASVVAEPTTSGPARGDSPTEIPASTDNATASMPTVPDTSTRRETTTLTPPALLKPESPQDTTANSSRTDDPDRTVTYNHNSGIYHCPTCSRAKACTTNCTDITLRDALSRDARACKICDGICKQESVARPLASVRIARSCGSQQRGTPPTSDVSIGRTWRRTALTHRRHVSQPRCTGPQRRATLWELHPVTDIRVCPREPCLDAAAPSWPVIAEE